MHRTYTMRMRIAKYGWRQGALESRVTYRDWKACNYYCKCEILSTYIVEPSTVLLQNH